MRNHTDYMFQLAK